MLYEVITRARRRRRRGPVARAGGRGAGAARRPPLRGGARHDRPSHPEGAAQPAGIPRRRGPRLV